MDSNLVNVLISLVSGAVGGNVGGAAAKSVSMGPLWNTVLGAIGGLGGGQLAGTVEGLQGMGVGANIGGSAIVGALLPLIIGFIKKKMAA